MREGRFLMGTQIPEVTSSVQAHPNIPGDRKACGGVRAMGA